VIGRHAASQGIAKSSEGFEPSNPAPRPNPFSLRRQTQRPGRSREPPPTWRRYYFMHYNFARIHKTLRVSRVMEPARSIMSDHWRRSRRSPRRRGP
jgi:hypothetical protein